MMIFSLPLPILFQQASTGEAAVINLTSISVDLTGILGDAWRNLL